MKYGPNTDAFEEVLEFIHSGRLFTGAAPPDGVECRVVSEPPPNIYYAGPYGRPEPFLDEGEDVWGACVENFLGDSCKALFGLPNPVQHAVKTATADLFEIVGSQVPERWYAYVGEIASDLSAIAQWRAGAEREPGFWETVFAVYRAGCWLVGWAGRHPDGVPMIVAPGLPTIPERKASDTPLRKWIKANAKAQKRGQRTPSPHIDHSFVQEALSLIHAPTFFKSSAVPKGTSTVKAVPEVTDHYHAVRARAGIPIEPYIDSENANELIGQLYETLGFDWAEHAPRIADDICNVLRARHDANAPGRDFWLRMGEIFDAGGWQVGWDGRYPEGRPLVVHPNIAG